MAKLKLSNSKTVELVISAMILLCVTVFTMNFDLIIKLVGGGINDGTADPRYQIDIYYFPGRKPTAFALSDFFNQQGYLVNTLKATKLKNSEATQFSQSHFFFNREDLSQAMLIKKQMQQVLGYPISAYKFREAKQTPSMRIVFTNAELEGKGEHATHSHGPHPGSPVIPSETN